MERERDTMRELRVEANQRVLMFDTHEIPLIKKHPLNTIRQKRRSTEQGSDGERGNTRKPFGVAEYLVCSKQDLSQHYKLYIAYWRRNTRSMICIL